MLLRSVVSRAAASRCSIPHAPRAGVWQYRSLASTANIRRTLPRGSSLLQRRFESSSRPRLLSDRSGEAAEPNPDREEAPQYEMTFTCRKCLDRSTHRISKQAYHHGTTLITCPGCKNRHLISDHLRIFSDRSITLEDILREKGQLLKKGSLSEDGNVEFWNDGTETKRT